MTPQTHPPAIIGFSGQYRFLSNFANTPFWLTLDNGYRFWCPTQEHAYQTAKAVTPTDRDWVARAASPGEAKRRGRVIECRRDWNLVKRRIMLQGLLVKFSQPDLAAALTATGDAELVEGNTWGDHYWGAVPYTGVSYGRAYGTAAPEGHYTGQNWLGRLLMTTRTLLAPE